MEKENGVDDLGKDLGCFGKEPQRNFISSLEVCKKLVWCCFGQNRKKGMKAGCEPCLF